MNQGGLGIPNILPNSEIDYSRERKKTVILASWCPGLCAVPPPIPPRKRAGPSDWLPMNEAGHSNGCEFQD